MSDAIQFVIVTGAAVAAAAAYWWPRRRRSATGPSSKDSCPGCGSCGDDQERSV